IETDAIHGNKSQNARTRALKSFKDGELRVLVATDIAARGLDIEQLPHVVNYDMPHVPEDYIHRIGRTGRAGAAGEAVSLVSHDERALLVAIETLIGRRVECSEVPGFSSHAEPRAVKTATKTTPHAYRHRTVASRPQPHSRAPSRKHPQQPETQHHRSAEPQLPRAPAPGYRPLTAHGRTQPVAALLSRNKSRSS
ncbi:MAG: helicase-related protein, partial [Burkholderiales bacterium]